MTLTRNVVRGTTEYVDVTITANVSLNTQPVSLSFDGSTWLTATWVGTAGTTRTARVLLTPTNTPAPQNNPVYAMVTDSPEIPEFRVGNLFIEG